MTSILIVDRDSSVRTSLQAAFHRRDGVACAALDPSESHSDLSNAAHEHDGILVGIDDDPLAHGWAVARQAREAHPAIAIGYLSPHGERSWAASGVPHSVVFATTADPVETAAAFLLLCRPAHAAPPDMCAHAGHTPQHVPCTPNPRLGRLGNDLIHASRRTAMEMMATTIANELNQPLTTISNYLAVARSVVQSDGDRALVLDSLQSAADASRSAGTIIRNLQSLTTQHDAPLEPVALDQTLRDIAEIVSLGRHQARISLDLPESLTVLGDRILIQQTLLNLLQNAVEASNGTAVDILVSASNKDQIVEICVADTGPGIDRTLLRTVFDPFVTSKTEGLGVGLSICQASVEAQGGVITLRNRANGGAIACFTVPRVG